MLNCEAILQRVGGARVATVAKTEEIVRFRTEKPHAGDYERDGLRFDYTLTCIIPRDINTLFPPSRTENIVIAGMGFLIMRRDGHTQEERPDLACWVYPLRASRRGLASKNRKRRLKSGRKYK